MATRFTDSHIRGTVADGTMNHKLVQKMTNKYVLGNDYIDTGKSPISRIRAQIDIHSSYILNIGWTFHIFKWTVDSLY